MGVFQSRDWPPEGDIWSLDIVESVGEGLPSGVDWPLGNHYVTIVGISMVTITDIDDTPLSRKPRVICWVNGRRVKTRIWFDDTEPTTGPIRKYPEIDLNYLQTKFRMRDPYQVTLRGWTKH